MSNRLSGPIARDGVYHKTVGGIPCLPADHLGLFALQHAVHAVYAAKTDRYAPRFELPTLTEIEQDDIIELEIRDGKIQKIVTRTPHSDGLDITMVLKGFDLELRSTVLKTVWLNQSSDHHRTLRRDRYTTTELELSQ